MTNRIADVSLRKAAIVVVVAYLIMFIAVLLTAGVQSLIVPGDAAETANNIMANDLLFRVGFCGYLIILICDVVMAWGLYVFLKPVNKSLSLLAAWFRLLYTAVFGMALLNIVTALRLLSGAEHLAVFETDQLHAQVLLSLNAFSDGWAIGYAFFSLHLFLLGYLVYKSGYIPRILGVLLIISSFTYLIDNAAKLLLPNYENYVAIFMVLVVPSFLGEFLLVGWLLLKGRKIPAMKKQDGTPA